jgi:hypothetical protein
MNDPFLKSRLGPLARRQRGLQSGCLLAGCWLGTALAGLVLVTLLRELGFTSRYTLPAIAGLGVVVAVGVAWWHRRRPQDWRALARQVEARHPELEGRLLTAVQLSASPLAEPHFLERRLVDEVLDHSYRHAWSRVIPFTRVLTAHGAQLLALLLVALLFHRLQPAASQPVVAQTRLPAGVTVSPGDTELERGESLVVMARFGGPVVPANVDLIVLEPDGSTRRLPLVKSLADPMFGGSVPGVAQPFRYHLEFGDERTADYQVTVFEHPRLERADADLTYPAYTGLAPKRLDDTKRITAVEGTRLDLALQLNKPVASARLIATDAEAAVVPLSIDTNRPVATLSGFPLATTRTYRLELLDTELRTNKVPATFVFLALTNRLPELKIVSPRGDTRPSPLEEMVFEGSVWDDFGVEAYGLGYTLVGDETRFLELGRTVPARQPGLFRHLLRLEDLNVAPDQLLAWFLWAEDLGPDGAPRRTTGDLFFAEIRPFEEIYREGAAGQEGEQAGQQPGQQGQGDSPSTQLADLQKQIISATWRLQRDHGPTSRPAGTPLASAYPQDAGVVRDAQAQALDQATEAAGQAEDPRTTAFWKMATDAMQKALAELEESLESPAPLPQALAAEQAAYQALLRLQQREFEVTRSRNRSQGQQAGSRQQQRQRQLDQLELTQSENRYETQRQAQAPAETERREQLQVLNRLAELARRQQDLNERLRELQTALAEARTEAEREEIRRELKRLQDEQRQMLSDVDELDQRMDRPENQSRMAESRQELEQARQDMQRAAEAAEQGAVSQALAAGTRAQRRVQDLREEMRRSSASEFAEDLREMRTEARELARRQEQLAEQLGELGSRERRRLDDTAEREDLTRQLSEQTDRLTNLVSRATQVSQQAEASEPLVSQQLYDSLRKFHQDEGIVVKEFQEELFERGLMTRSLLERLEQTAAQDGAKALEVTSEMLRQGFLPQADRAEQRARAGIGELRRGVERAAERVLGDDTESLRLAQRELDQLTEQLEREAAQGQTDGSESEPAQRGQPGGAGEPGQPQPDERQPQLAEGRGGTGDQPATENAPGENQQAQREGQSVQGQGGQPGEPGDQPAEPQGSGQPGQPGQPRDSEGAPPDSARPGGGEGQLAGDPSDPTRGGRAPQPGAERTPGGQREGSDARNAGPGGRGGPLANAFDRWLDADNPATAGPLTGPDFSPWSDRLREVEEMVELPSLRSELAQARERARQIRQEFRRDLKKPDWAVVQLEIVRPLVEVRRQVAEELARREPANELVPIDRDPVPGRFAEQVRRYYEELGRSR